MPKAPELLRICPMLSLIHCFPAQKNPEDEIPEMYACLEEIPESQKLQDFMQYVGRTWITSRTWPPSSWSVFMKSIRTNNNLGWIAVQPESRNFHGTFLLVCSTLRPAWLHFKSGPFQRRSYGAFTRSSSGTSRQRSSPYGMRLTLETATCKKASEGVLVC